MLENMSITCEVFLFCCINLYSVAGCPLEIELKAQKYRQGTVPGKMPEETGAGPLAIDRWG
jgi:hypothetical protein